MVFRAVVRARPDLSKTTSTCANIASPISTGAQPRHDHACGGARARYTLNTREAFTFSSFVVRCMCYAHLHRRPPLMVAIARSEP
jgi:hypothetical protein